MTDIVGIVMTDTIFFSKIYGHILLPIVISNAPCISANITQKVA